jgi:hypothetical protein
LYQLFGSFDSSRTNFVCFGSAMARTLPAKAQGECPQVPQSPKCEYYPARARVPDEVPAKRDRLGVAAWQVACCEE